MTDRRASLERVRAIALGLPEVAERVSHGEPGWAVPGRSQFAMFADRHHDGRLAVWVGTPVEAQAMLLAEAPDRYFRPPYVGVRGWVGVYLDVPDVDWDELALLIKDAWRIRAPKRLVAAFDAR